MPKAVWNDHIIAESDETVVVEGNHYFPPESVDLSVLEDSDRTTMCGWKGMANYKDIVVDGDVNPNAAWYYADPKRAARKITGFYAFWHGVKIID